MPKKTYIVEFKQKGAKTTEKSLKELGIAAAGAASGERKLLQSIDKNIVGLAKLVATQTKYIQSLKSRVGSTNEAKIATDKLRNSTKKAGKETDRMRIKTSGFRRELGAIRNNVLLYTFALAGVVAAGKKAIDAAGIQEKAEKRLEVALGRRSQALLDQATALQKVTTFGDEQIISAQALIAAFVSDEDQIKAATKATLDLAAAKGMDLTAAADLISKTLGSSTNAMSRYGIQVEGAVGSTERLESLTNSIEDKFGGQAKATAEGSGQLKQMTNAVGDTAEAIGRKLLPTVISLAGWIKTASERMTEFLNSLNNSTPEKELVLLQAVLNKLINSGLVIQRQGLFGQQMFEGSDAVVQLASEISFKIETLTADLKANSEALKANSEALGSVKEDYEALNDIISANKIIFKNNTEFQLLQIQLQADQFRAMKLDEVAITEWAEQAKFDILEKSMFQRNILLESASAGYDTFINSLVDMEITGKVRREEVWKATKTAFIKAGGELIKEFIKNIIIRNAIEKTGQATSIASALVTGRAIAATYAVPAALASTASFGGAAAAGTAGILASVAATKALAAFAKGGDFTTSGPQIIMVGDNPGGKERVQVTPLSSPNINGPSGGTTIQINGDVYGFDDFRDKVRQANQTNGLGLA